jgi:hypothetical protein
MKVAPGCCRHLVERRLSFPSMLGDLIQRTARLGHHFRHERVERLISRFQALELGVSQPDRFGQARI